MGVGSKVDYWRQTGIVTPDELPAVTMIGAGGIGSFTVLGLCKMGVTDIAAYDDDIVEDHNLPNQLYEIDDIDLYKVAALNDICENFTGIKIRMEMERYPGDNFTPVMISGVDSMAARQDIWDKVKMRPQVQLYVEARMGAEVSRIYSINPCDPDDIEFYEQQLYSDDEASEEPCTARAIIYNGFAIAALICSQVKKFAKHETVVKEIIFDMKTLTLMTQ